MAFFLGCYVNAHDIDKCFHLEDLICLIFVVSAFRG